MYVFNCELTSIVHSCTTTHLLAGITWEALKRKPEFDRVLPELNAWFNTQLRGRTAGVLVSHNNVTDVQFLLCEYIRAGSTLPPKINLTLDTLATIKRFSTSEGRFE